MTKDESEPMFRPGDEEAPDTDAIVAVLLEHRSDFVAFVASRVASREIAEEIVQDAFARGVTKVETVRDGESAVAWFYRVLRNAVVDYHCRRRTAEKALETFANEVTTHQDPPEEIRDVVCRCVKRLAGTLKPEYAAALVAVEVDEKPVAEFAAEQGITANNAAVRVFRARDALRRRVIASCGACAEHGCLVCTCRHAPDENDV